VAERDNKTSNAQDHAAYTARLPSDFNQTLRNSPTRSLETYFAPLDQAPAELSELLARLEQADKKGPIATD
jgi:hypothetical protein